MSAPERFNNAPLVSYRGGGHLVALSRAGGAIVTTSGVKNLTPAPAHVNEIVHLPP